MQSNILHSVLARGSSLTRTASRLQSRRLSTTARSKVYPSSLACVHDISDNSSVMFGGFGVTGVPENLIAGIMQTSAKNLTGIAIDVCTDEYGLGLLLESKQVTKLHCCYVGEHPSMAQLFYNGEVELNLWPMGTLVEKIRSAGAGIPAFYTATGVNTSVQEGNLPCRYNKDGSVAMRSKAKESREFDGRQYILEEAIEADFACIKAWKGDSAGNLVFRSVARNSNPDCAKAARVCIAEVEELVEEGELAPDEIHLPGIYVDRVVVGEKYDKLFERIKFGEPDESDGVGDNIGRLTVPYSKLPPVSTLQRIHLACFPNSKVTHGRLHTHSHNMCHGQKVSAPFAAPPPSSSSSSPSSTSSSAVPLGTAANSKPVSSSTLIRERIGRRAAQEFENGMVVNLGIGIPTVAANYVPPHVNVKLQSENGLLGMGPYPVAGETLADPDLTNAGKEPVTYLPGSSAFGASESFAMIRGKHIDLVLLGCLQVSAKGK